MRFFGLIGFLPHPSFWIDAGDPSPFGKGGVMSAWKSVGILVFLVGFGRESV